MVWERSAGQAVQILLTLAVLLVLPSPVRSVAPLVAVAVLGVAAGAALAIARVAAGRDLPPPRPKGRSRSPPRSSSRAMPSPS